MAYEKQTWADGDIITAEKLNHIENGIENSSVAVYTYHGDGIDDVDTLYDFITNNYGKKIIFVNDESEGFISTTVINASAYGNGQTKTAGLDVLYSDGETIHFYQYSNTDPSEPNIIFRGDRSIFDKNN